MPLAFGSLLGGLVTLIGTPPNIIISSYRAEILGKSFGEGGGFGMFEFAPVGAGTQPLRGSLYCPLRVPVNTPPGKQRQRIGRASPYRRLRHRAVRPQGSPLIGQPIRELVVLADGDIAVVAVIRDGNKVLAPPWYTRMRASIT